MLNGALTIGDQLDAVLSQAFDGPFEVLVADNGSTDGTVDLVRARSATDSRVRLVDASAGPRSAGAARNAGAEQAVADHLVFCDADDVVRPGWLSAIQKGLLVSPVVTATLEYWSLNPQVSPRTQPEYVDGYQVCGVPGICSGAFGIRRATFAAVGRFAPVFAGAEDSELAVRLHRSGHVPVHQPDAVVSVRLRARATDAFRRGRNLRGSVVTIRSFHGIPQPSARQMLKRLAWDVRVLLTTSWCGIRPSGRVAWMHRAGETVADAEFAVRRLLRRV